VKKKHKKISLNLDTHFIKISPSISIGGNLYTMACLRPLGDAFNVNGQG